MPSSIYFTWKVVLHSSISWTAELLVNICVEVAALKPWLMLSSIHKLSTAEDSGGHQLKEPRSKNAASHSK